MPIFFHNDIRMAAEKSVESSLATHPGPDASAACRFLAYFIVKAIKRPDNDETTPKAFLEQTIQDFVGDFDMKSDTGMEKLERLLASDPPQPPAPENEEAGGDAEKPQEPAKKKWALFGSSSSPEPTSTSLYPHWHWKREEELPLHEAMINRRRSKAWRFPVSRGYFGAYSLDGLAMALWGFYNAKCFDHACALVFNLLGDADSTGSVVGQMAGAFFGLQAIREQGTDSTSCVVGVCFVLFVHVFLVRSVV